MEQQDFNIKIMELELKYFADDISLAKFQTLAEELNYKKLLVVGGLDTYYTAPDILKDTGIEFLRYRHGLTPELTFKIKTNQNNNNSRIEVDLPLSKKITKFIINKFVNMLGFKENFEIYKECYIYFYDKIDIVYYTVRDKEEGKVLAKFIEIEARKDAKFTSEEEAWKLVKEMEQNMNVLGISPQNRLKRSMWEIFRKDI